ncbi:hypothetical protein GMSM_34360 [Geomonas sp. Red276]
MSMPLRCIPLVLLLLLPSLSWGSDFHNALSLQGFTGLLNTPNAETTEEGTVYLTYSNQKEPERRSRITSEESVNLALGIYDGLELSGRFFDARPYGNGRDLSGNLKLRIPFIPRGPYIPTFAVGVQDVYGGHNASFLKTKYAVASEELWRFRFSLGYGTGPDRMKGTFGGVEFKAADWLYLLAEDDTTEKNVGIRLISPSVFGFPAHLHLTFKSSLDHEPLRPEFAAGLQLPLGLDHNYAKPIPVPETTAGKQVEAPSPAAAAAVKQAPTPADAAGLERLVKRLTGDGFQNVRVGYLGPLLLVEYENARYDHNELDAMGVVMGYVQLEAPAAFDTVRMVERKKGISVLQVEVPIPVLRAFFQDATNLERLQDNLKISREVADASGFTFVSGGGNSSYLTTSLWVYPGLKAYVGTEVGIYDYLISVKPDFYVNLWKGAFVDMRADIPVTWSRNFDDGKAFRSDRNSAGIERAMVLQAIKPADTVMMMLGAGLVTTESYGTANEVSWAPGDGTHRFRFLHVYTTGQDKQDKKQEYLGSYRYLYAPLDLYFQGTAGKFMTQDRGATIEIKRFWGDSSLTVFYKNAVATDNRNHQAAGIQFDLPLTLRKDMKPGLVQLRGTDDWTYSQETSIAKKNSLNWLGTPIGARLEPPFSTENLFFNRDRLSEPYIRKHLLRLRDAYVRYVVPSEPPPPLP